MMKMPSWKQFSYKLSDWECYLFGAVPGNGFKWVPDKKNVPCWFWRKMQYLILGNRWVKKEKK